MDRFMVGPNGLCALVDDYKRTKVGWQWNHKCCFHKENSLGFGPDGGGDFFGRLRLVFRREFFPIATFREAGMDRADF